MKRSEPYGNFPGHRLPLRKEGYGLIDCHVQYLADILAAVLDFKNVRQEAPAPAGLAGHHYVSHELHRYLHGPFPLAFGTASAVYIEGEMRMAVIVQFRIRLFREQFPYIVIYFQICHRIRTGILPDGILVHIFHRRYPAEVPSQLPEGPRSGSSLSQMAHQGGIKDVPHQCGFAGAADTCHGGHDLQRETHVDMLQVILAGIAHFYVTAPSLFGRSRGYFLPAEEILEGQGLGISLRQMSVR